MIFPKRQRLRRFTGTDLDFGPSAVAKITLTSSPTFTRITGGSDGELLTLFVQQDGTGSRTVTWPAAVVWVGGAAPTLDTDPNDLNIIQFWKIGTTYIGLTLTAQVAAAANAAAHVALSADL